MPELDIRVLGPFTVVRRGSPVPVHAWERRTNRLLLQLLLTAPGQAFHQDEIIGSLWPGLGAEAAASSLRAAVSRLRRVLEPDLPHGSRSRYIIRSAAGYAFVVCPDCRIDVVEFESMSEAGRRAEAGGAAQAACDLYQGALALCEGPYLPEADSYAWVAAAREAFQKQRLETLAGLARCLGSLRDFGRVVAVCRQWLAEDPCSEPACQALMQASAARGDVAGVATAYREVVRRLSEDLGVGPSAATTQLYRDLVTGTAREAAAPHIPSPGLTLPFIGRKREFGRLAACLNGLEGETAQVVLVQGEAGVGKSRLLQELAAEARRRGMAVLAARCYEEPGAPAYAPVTDIVRQALALLGGKELESFPPLWLAEAARLLPELKPLARSEPAGAESGGNQALLLEALSQLILGACSGGRGLMIIADDLHWADPSTLKFLLYLRRRAARRAVLLVGAYRPEEPMSTALGEFFLHLARGGALRLGLNPLGQGAIADLIGRLGGLGVPPGRRSALASLLHRETGGNAFFLAETINEIQEQGGAARNGEEGLPRSLPVSSGIRSLVLQRVARLPGPSRAALDLVAFAGHAVSREALERAWNLLQGAVPGPLAPHLELLIQRRLLIDTPNARLDTAHDKIRQVLVRTADPPGVRRLHAALADALAGAGDPSAAADVARHLLAAGDAERAVPALLQAAEAAERLSVHESALSCLSQAMDVLKPAAGAKAERQRVEVLLRIEALCHNLGDRDRRRRAVDKLLAAAALVGDPGLLRVARLRHAGIVAEAGDLAGARRAISEVIAACRRAGDRHGEVGAQRELAFILYREGHAVEALAAHTEALALARSLGDRQAQAAELNNRGHLLLDLGRPEEALADWQAAREICIGLGDRDLLRPLNNLLFRVHREMGDLERALAISREGAEKDGGVWAMRWRLNVAGILLQQGKLIDAAGTYGEVLDLYRQLGGEAQCAAVAHQGLALLMERWDRRDEAAEHCRLAADAFDQAGDAEGLARVQRQLERLEAAGGRRRPPVDGEAVLAGQRAWHEGRYRESITLLKRAVREARAAGHRLAEGEAQATLGACYLALRRFPEALAATHAALDVALATSDALSEGRLLHNTARAYRGLGLLELAAQAADRAVALRRAAGDAEGSGWSALLLTEIQRLRGEQAAASAQETGGKPDAAVFD